MALRIKKSYVVPLASWLNEQKLVGKQSRERTRFVEILADEAKKMDAGRIEMLERHAEKDKEGNPKKETVDNQESFSLSEEGQKEFVKEYVELLNEEFVIDVTDANTENINTVKNIVLDTEYRFGPQEGDSEEEKQARIRQMNDYPYWCSAFEHLDA